MCTRELEPNLISWGHTVLLFSFSEVQYNGLMQHASKLLSLNGVALLIFSSFKWGSIYANCNCLSVSLRIFGHFVLNLFCFFCLMVAKINHFTLWIEPDELMCINIFSLMEFQTDCREKFWWSGRRGHGPQVPSWWICKNDLAIIKPPTFV